MTALMRHTSTWTLTVAGVVYDFEVLSGRMRLDERNSIYGVGSVVVAPVPTATFDVLTATSASLRATLVTARDVITGTETDNSRTFDLAVVEVTKDPQTKEVTFQLRTDEALLEARGRVAATPRDSLLASNSVAALVEDIIKVYYPSASLTSAGAANADATYGRFISRQNLLVNGQFEAALTGWTVNGSAVLSRQTTNFQYGTASMRAAASGAGDVRAVSPKMKLPSSGRVIGVMYVKPGTTGRSARAEVRLYDSANTLVGTILGSTVAIAVNTYDAVTISHYEPEKYPTATDFTFSVLVSSVASGQNIYFDGGFCYEMVDDDFLFNPDGSIASTRSWATLLQYDDPSIAAQSTYHDYAWDGDGTAYVNTYRITPKATLPTPAQLLHTPGQTAAEFLEPLVQLTGGRLFCDEARLWRLVKDTYTPSGTVALDEARTITGVGAKNSLAESIDGVPTNFTGVVLEYRVPSTPGRRGVRIDWAGTSTGRVYYRRVDGTYPGTGAAAAMLARATGRVQGVPITALSDYSVKPGQAMTMTIDGDALVGVVSSVEWVYGASNSDEMTIEPRDVA